MILTERDKTAVTAMTNFLSWGARPARDGEPTPDRFIPPAVWAYVFGASTWCPPKGEW